MRKNKVNYEKGYVYKLMDQGGPTDVRESYTLKKHLRK